ncbi:hypothetical protein [Paenibacillus sp. 22594]
MNKNKNPRIPQFTKLVEFGGFGFSHVHAMLYSRQPGLDDICIAPIR